jgi:hypothetical protein
MMMPTPQQKPRLNNAPSVKFGPTYLTEQGECFFRDESGANPHIVIDNIPSSWNKFGRVNLALTIGLGMNDDNTVNTVQRRGKTLGKPAIPLSKITDKKYNTKQLWKPDNYVVISREWSEKIEVPFCKALPLCRDYKGGAEDLPEFFIFVAPVNGNTVDFKHGIHSQEIVIMSKRQPTVIAKMNGKTINNGMNNSKRQKRTEKIKTLVENEAKLVEHIKRVEKEKISVQLQNDKMKEIFTMLDNMSRDGLTSNNPVDILRCMAYVQDSIKNCHWMKPEVQIPISPLKGSGSSSNNNKRKRV